MAVSLIASINPNIVVIVYLGIVEVDICQY